MATYQDNAELMNEIYKYGTLDEHGNDVTNNISYEDTNKKPVTWTKVQVAGHYIELNNPTSGYYGALYQKGNEYILVNRGTNNIQDKINDGLMALGNIPGEFYDAYALAKQASSYINSHGRGSLAMTGHSEGATQSVLQGIIFGGEVNAFNPYNSKNFLDKVERVDSSTIERLTLERNVIQENMNSDSQQALAIVDRELLIAEATNALYDSWHNNGGSNTKITNYRIENDPVSGAGAIQKDHLGETITITYESKGDAKLMGSNEYVVLDGLNAALHDFFADVDTFHSANNFLLENLTSSSGNLQIKSSKASNSDALLELAAFFKDKNNFEIDQTGAGSITVGRDHELYVGFGKNWVSSSDDRSQLVTAVHDSIYTNAGYKSSGSLSQVQMMVERIQAQFANDKYFYVKSVESPDLQTYILIAPKDPKMNPNVNDYLTNAENWRPPRDPLAVDLDGDGIETVSQNAGIVFDTDADGLKTGTSWLKGDDGWVVIDKNNNGKIDNGSELFGDAYVKQDGTKAEYAYDALEDIDSNHDGIITAADAKFAELKIWQDKNQNAISEAGELKTLSEIGLVELKVGRTSSAATNLGNGVVTNGGSTMVINGVEQQTGALNLSQNTFYREFADKLDTSSVADLPELVGSGFVRDLREAMTLSAELTQDVRTYMSLDATERSKMLDELASDWAATSTLSTSKNRHTEAHTDFYFSGIDSSSNPNAQSEMLDKLAIVETFNGRRINAGNESQTVIYQRDAYGNVLRDVNGSPLVSYVHTNVSFSEAQTSWILQSYNSITNSIDKGLSVYTDVVPFLSSTNLKITETNGLLLDIPKILQNLDMNVTPEQNVAKIIGLASFLNESGNLLVSAVEQQELIKWIDYRVNVEGLDVSKYISDWVYNKGNTSNNDVIFCRDTKNIISGLNGDDVVFAMGGDDEISGGVGNETIYGGFGKDILSGNDGNDILSGENDEDQMYGGNGDDQIYGGSGNDYLNGGFGYNYLNGGDGNDTLIASTNENFNGSWDRHRSNTLEGGRGDDYLQGHVAADIYIYNKGDGKDTIEDIGLEWFGNGALNNKYGNRNDIIQFGAGITKDDLQIVQSGNSLLINIGTSGEDSIIISNYFVDNNRKIEEIRFTDDSSLNLGQYVTENIVFHRDGSDSNDTLTGLETRDELFGLGGDDKINGGAGRDILNGGTGNDTLDGGLDNDVLFGGEGNDYLYSGDSGSRDELYGDAGDDKLYGNSFDDQIYGGSGNDYLNGGFGYNYLNGGDGNDTLIASTNENFNGNWDRHRSNTLEGGRGDDYLQGHVAADVYIYNKGDGKDTIEDIGLEWFGNGALNNKYGNRNDIIQFGAGITKDDLQIVQSANSLLIKIGASSEDSITITNYFVDNNRKIEEIRFADDSLLDLGLYVTENIEFYRGGSDGNDIIYGQDVDDNLAGGLGDDKIYGRAGNDIILGEEGDDTLSAGTGRNVLYGGAGNDTLVADVYNYDGNVNQYIGGVGDDYLHGANGSDTYVFNLGDGHDTILDEQFRVASTGWGVDYYSKYGFQVDAIEFGIGINKEDLSFSKSGNDLIINIGTDGANSIRIKDVYVNTDRYLERFAFADGTNLAFTDVIIPTLGNDSNEVLYGFETNDVINAKGGDDVVYAQGGNDTVDGGDGNDIIYGQNGSDNLIGRYGDDRLYGEAGDDTILGGDGNDTLSAGTGRNILDGGSGNDILSADVYNYDGNVNQYIGGAGDDYLHGANGSDTYVFNLGDGHDTILDEQFRVASTGWGVDYYSKYGFQVDAIEFGIGINKEDLSFSKSGNDLIINIGTDGANSIRIKDVYVNTDRYLERFAFADGTNLAFTDVIIPTLGNDSNEVLYGFETNDVINAKGGDDVVYAQGGNDTVDGGDGNDIIYGQNGSDNLIGRYGDDRLYGEAGDDTILGGDGNDTLSAGTGRNILDGGSGNDILSADVYNYDGNVNQYIGGAGDDYLHGANGSDTYVFNLGDGHDTILDEQFRVASTGWGVDYYSKYGFQVDAIEFGIGINKEDLSFSKSGNDLIINIGTDGANSIRIKDVYVNTDRYLERFAFADGTNLAFTDVIIPTLGNDSNEVLYGFETNDVINAKGGDDVVYAQGGNDTVDGGDGNDIIYGQNGSDNLIGRYGDDRLYGEAGDDTILGGDGNDTLSAGTGRNILDGGSGNDILSADVYNYDGNVNQYIGGAGDDYLHGANGSDTYVFNLGDGHDTILDEQFRVASTGWGVDYYSKYGFQVDAIEFGVGIIKDDLSFSKSSNDLVITIGANGADSLTIKDHFIDSNRQIELIAFADGTQLTKDEYIKNLSINLAGTDSSETLTSARGNDTIIAKGGNDTITSGAGRDTIDAGSGDDIINAGTGNDTITGGSGNDTYIYKAGDGQDTIRDIAGTDTLNLQAIQASALKFTQDNNDLLINFTNMSSDSIRVSEWFGSADNRIEQLKLDDGSILDLNVAVEAQLITKYGTSANDILELTAAKTQVIAGTGNDAITDTTSNNTTYIFNKGDGKDTILESNSSTDTIQLNNITPQEISYSKIDNDLIINLGTDDSITIKDFTNRANRIENINFNNGMTMLLAEALATAKVFGNDKTVTSNADDNLWLEQGAKINLREGNNQAYINSNGIATTVTSGAGNDNVEVYDNANVTLSLGNGNNSALVKDGNHVITSGIGSDTVTLGAGVSSLNVGDGNDNVTITKTQANSSFSVSLGAGNDSLKVNGTGGAIKVSNSSGDDIFNLANINSQISASAGNNLINLDNSGITGDTNSISLAVGNDQLTVESGGQTTIRAGEGTNQINLGGGGSFSVSAGGGDDQVKIQGLANSSLSLGNGNNTILAQDGNHKITTGIGNDNITIGGGISTISSGDGDDNVTITTTQNTSKYTVNLGAGNDSLNFNGNGGELAQISSSSGNDQINVNNIRSQITLSSGDNTVNLNNSQLSGESNAINTGAGNDTIAVNSNGINTINAGNGANQITLSGNSSNTVTSGSGNDVIKSDAGSLTLNSGAGNDNIEINSSNAQDKFALNVSDGNDTVKIIATGAATTIANNYGDDSYDLTGTQVKLSDALGNTTLILNNQQLTNETNTITTGAGNDNINITSDGSNTVNTGNGNNQIAMSGNSKDIITSGSGDDVVLAGAGDDIINAGAGNDIINGGTDNDVLNGSTGNDTYIFNKGDGADIIQDAGGNDVMKLGEGIRKEDLWFKKDNKDLTINNLTNQDKMTVKNWYSGSANKIEQIELADGEHISNISIDLLVQAMATFDVKPMAETHLTPTQQNTIQTALANTWVDPTK